MAGKYDEMAQQMRADGVDEERAKDEFLRGCGTTDIEAARTWGGHAREHPAAAVGQRLLPQLRHGVVRKRLLTAHARRLRAHRGQVRHLRRRDHQALRLGPPVTARLDSPLASPALAERSRSSTDLYRRFGHAC